MRKRNIYIYIFFTFTQRDKRTARYGVKWAYWRFNEVYIYIYIHMCVRIYMCTHMHACMYVPTYIRKCMRNIELYIGIFSLLFEIRGAISTKEYEYSPRLSSTIKTNFITKILKHLSSWYIFVAKHIFYIDHLIVPI